MICWRPHGIASQVRAGTRDLFVNLVAQLGEMCVAPGLGSRGLGDAGVGGSDRPRLGRDAGRMWFLKFWWKEVN